MGPRWLHVQSGSVPKGNREVVSRGALGAAQKCVWDSSPGSTLGGISTAQSDLGAALGGLSATLSDLGANLGGVLNSSARRCRVVPNNE